MNKKKLAKEAFFEAGYGNEMHMQLEPKEKDPALLYL